MPNGTLHTGSAPELGAWLVARLGFHPMREIRVDPRAPDDDGLRCWLFTAALLQARVAEDRALASARAACENGWGAASGPERDPAELTAILEVADYPRPEAASRLLVRLGRSLDADYGGSLSRLAADCEGLEELGGRLARLAPGFGPAAVARFLRPLREVWAAADDLPLAASARAAALHLGWADETDDPAHGASILRRVVCGQDGPSLPDLEAALERLGTVACRRDRVDRCPLEARCPQRRLG